MGVISIRRLSLIAIVLLLWGCGKKAPPIPWSAVVPKRIVDLQALSREGRLLLEWTAPKENTDKSVLTDLKAFHLMRSEGDVVDGECRGCGGQPKLAHVLDLSGSEDPRGKRFSFVVEDLEPRKVYTFVVVSVNRRGYSSSASNSAEVFWDEPPPEPAWLKGEPGDRKVELFWDPVPGATGYHVYRRFENETYSSVPLNKTPIVEPGYVDLGVENDRAYIYTVRALKRTGKTDIEGRGSPEVTVVPLDLSAPSAPSGLVAIPLKHGIELSWRKNSEPDLLGYHVYRRLIGEPSYERLTPNPIQKEVYLDSSVIRGLDYEYAVTAVDRSPRRNESPFSEEVRVRYIY